MKRFFVALFAAFLLVPAAHAGRTTELKNFHNEAILETSSANAEKITQNAILKSAQALGWKVVKNTPSLLQLRLDVRNKHTIVVGVKIKGNKVDVDYVSSDNMNYRRDEGGQEIIHPNYHRWITNLLQSARSIANKQ